ncbi:hypothetical protein NKDENANG_01410 [Candidatus Entotheonellaceae bacterium PAL068K]
MMQKTRYKRRKTHTITKALESDLHARMLKHPLYLNPVRTSPSPPQETDTLKVAT